jgi:hypothetical protein
MDDINRDAWSSTTETGQSCLAPMEQERAILRTLMAAGVLLFVAGCATAPDSVAPVPVDVVQGKLVKLWGVSSDRTEAGLVVSGSVTRQRVPNRPFNEHLHAESVNAFGSVLEAQNVPWNSIVSLRTQHSATFKTTFWPSGGEDIARVRLKVVAGAIHFED